MESELRQLQLKCLEILDIVVKICIEHDIKYSLCGGSVVGAHLYKGFIPWDDDIDIMMTRDNYNKFLEVAKDCIPKGYSIINYQNSDLSTKWKICFTKIINDNTTIVLDDGNIMGVFIDIDVYDKVPENPLKLIDIFLCERILTINKGKVAGKNIHNLLRNFFLNTVLHNRRKYLTYMQKIVEFLGKNASCYTYRELFGAYHGYNMKPYKASIFENYTTIVFEGRKVMIVRDYIDYLKTRYNRTDFYEPKERQKPPHYIYMDLTLPHNKYSSIQSKNE